MPPVDLPLGIASSPSDWPFQWEPVDLCWAKTALRCGNAHILGRYLQEADDPDTRLMQIVRRMAKGERDRHGRRLELRFSGRGRPPRRPTDLVSPRELGALLNPVDARRPAWFLKFVGLRGKPRRRSPAHKTTIRLKVLLALRTERKVELAVETVARAHGLHPRTIFRSMRGRSSRKKTN